MYKKQRGFTLVEIAIVLVIIGLLLGGVLKGQAMIENSRYKRLLADLDSFRSEVYMFQDRYRALPGDLTNANTKLNAAAASGNGNGSVDGGWCDAAGEESCLVWSHLRYAGLLGGDPTLTGPNARITDHPYGGIYDSISTGNWANGRTELKILMRNLPGDVAQRLDDELDDGNATTGEVARYGGSGASYDKNARLSVFVTL
ncbi:MAG TPA: prepilin-type N-terminal cleavage/methylation domain-containing protein [Gammaproteobacteria bacterium]|nr:prepilin-type N-terminal cleavage/methylation domain-containing protein [Gammaproteobacteria bacterium]